MPQLQLATATAVVVHTDIIHYSQCASLTAQCGELHSLHHTHYATLVPQNASQAEIWLSALKAHPTITKYVYRELEVTRLWLNLFVWPCTCILRWHCTSACVCVHVCVFVAGYWWLWEVIALQFPVFVCFIFCLFFSCANIAIPNGNTCTYLIIYYICMCAWR